MCAMHPMTSNIGDLKKWVPLSFVIYLRHIFHKEHAFLCSYLPQTCIIELMLNQQLYTISLIMLNCFNNSPLKCMHAISIYIIESVCLFVCSW